MNHRGEEHGHELDQAAKTLKSIAEAQASRLAASHQAQTLELPPKQSHKRRPQEPEARPTAKRVRVGSETEDAHRSPPCVVGYKDGKLASQGDGADNNQYDDDVESVIEPGPELQEPENWKFLLGAHFRVSGCKLGQ